MSFLSLENELLNTSEMPQNKQELIEKLTEINNMPEIQIRTNQEALRLRYWKEITAFKSQSKESEASKEHLKKYIEHLKSKNKTSLNGWWTFASLSTILFACFFTFPMAYEVITSLPKTNDLSLKFSLFLIMVLSGFALIFFGIVAKSKAKIYEYAYQNQNFVAPTEYNEDVLFLESLLHKFNISPKRNLISESYAVNSIQKLEQLTRKRKLETSYQEQFSYNSIPLPLMIIYAHITKTIMEAKSRGVSDDFIAKRIHEEYSSLIEQYDTKEHKPILNIDIDNYKQMQILFHSTGVSELNNSEVMLYLIKAYEQESNNVDKVNNMNNEIVKHLEKINTFIQYNPHINIHQVFDGFINELNALGAPNLKHMSSTLDKRLQSAYSMVM